MEFLELSAESSAKAANELAEAVSKDFSPDAVVFVARGAYTLGLEAGRYFGVPVYEIFAERKGGGFKNKLRPLLRVIPSSVKAFLRSREISSGSHAKNSERNVYWGHPPLNAPDDLREEDIRRVLLIDDACDTGNTLSQCVRYISERFAGAEIRTAVLTAFDTSRDVFSADYCLYRNVMISGPWSNDSELHEEFINGYYEYFGPKQNESE
ncbi:MAG: phosphoribosyltransferase family protein [Huintestinicola sp.]